MLYLPTAFSAPSHTLDHPPDQSLDHQPSHLIDNSFAELRSPLVNLIEAVRNSFDIPGISLAVTYQGRQVWLEGFGYADQRRNTAVTPDTRFRAGSLAKPLTAMAVMQLAEKNLLDIDQPLTAYVADFSIRSRFDTTRAPITLRNMLSHHAGLPTDFNKGKWSEDNFRALPLLLKDEYAAYPPNLVFSYSNLAYSLLGIAIEQVQPMAFEDYMMQQVLTPAGMTNSLFSQQMPQDPRSSEGFKHGRSKALLPIRDIPAYGLVTTARDLGRLLQVLYNRPYLEQSKLLMPETFEEMLEAQNLDVALDLGATNGLGWFLENRNDSELPIIRHGGTTLYFNSELIYSPADDIGIALLSNASGSRQVIAELANEILKRFAQQARGIPVSGLDIASIKRQVRDIINRPIKGDYATDYGLVSIQARGDDYCGCIASETFDLIPYPNGWFGFRQSSVDSLPPHLRSMGRMQFQSRLIDDMEVIIARHGEKESVLGQRVPDMQIPSSWKKRVGRYRLLNPDKQFPMQDAQLLLQDGLLYMRYRMPLLTEMPIQSPLRPISDNEAIILGLGRSRGETLRATTVDDKEQLHYSGFIGIRR